MREERGMLNEAGGSAGNAAGAIGGNALSGSGLTTQTGGLAGFDPVMISLIRRAMPNLVAYDICGVQPMSGPTGLIFAMKSHYEGRDGAEALYNGFDSDFSAGFDATANAYDTANPVAGSNPGLLNDSGTYDRGVSSMAREDAEALGESGKLFREMSFSIEKTSVTAQSRALKAEYTLELAQDLKAIHGLDAEQELANILSSEILAEINREVVRTVYTIAKLVLRTTLQTLVSSTSMLTPTADGRLKSSRDLCSRSKETQTQLHRKLVEERATSSSLLLMLLLLSRCLVL